MGVRIHRVTLFKIPDPENQKKLLAAYETMAEEQQKVRSVPLTSAYCFTRPLSSCGFQHLFLISPMHVPLSRCF